MASFFTSYFLHLVLVANIFNFQTSLCDTSADEALIAGICRQVQDPPFCLNTFRQILAHPYVPEEVTRAAIAQSLQNANNNHAFIEAAKAAAKDKETQDLYAICDSSYGLLITVLQDAAQSLANKDYNGLENDLSKCPKLQILAYPYVPEEVTEAAIAQASQNANNNRAFIEDAKAAAKDKETQDLYAICNSSYGLLITVLQDATKSLVNKDYNGLENDLIKCSKFVSDCQNALGSKTTPEMLDRSRKQFDLVIMSQIAEGLIKK
ncbi:hypothetical protein MTR67_047249 [Solanum verrucosum]|uniref:Pectinesterase inhibitor domain-containing protein n=1 Tax=Solanum verrucosum TaxID=315347 RepID=A0AAF0UYJ1_SOLVR|nr:hypothetical protein MTR67_047249 [Solanum verrucosum]